MSILVLGGMFDIPSNQLLLKQALKWGITYWDTAAAMNTTRLSAAEMNLLAQLDRETASHYCTGCADICESSLSRSVPVADIMRFLMYRRS